MTDFAKRLKGCREHAGYTQEQLAEKIGVGRPLITQYERGTKPASDNIKIQLADIFGVTVDYLIGRDV